MKFILIFFALGLPYSVQAEIFQWLDVDGKRHYSDRPHSGSKALKFNTGLVFYEVKRVYDGDTILLANGMKIRFSGINTPEVESRNKMAEAGGEEAKRWLQGILKNRHVRLETDLEKKDKYGRWLAHVFTREDLHINLELVKQGLATVNIHPPNLKYSKALLFAQQQALNKHWGIWELPAYQPKAVAQLNPSHYRGWHRIVGVITGLRHTKKNSYLDFDDSFSVKIKQHSMSLFSDLSRFVGKKVEVRGWINKHRGHLYLLIRHPAAISLLE